MIITRYKEIYLGDNYTQLQEFITRQVMGLWRLPTYINLIYPVLIFKIGFKVAILAIREIYIRIRFLNPVLNESDLNRDILVFDEKLEKLLTIHLGSIFGTSML